MTRLVCPPPRAPVPASHALARAKGNNHCLSSHVCVTACHCYVPAERQEEEWDRMSVLKTIDADDDAAATAYEPARSAGVSAAPWRTLGGGIPAPRGGPAAHCPLNIEGTVRCHLVQAVDLRSYEEVKQEQQRHGG